MKQKLLIVSLLAIALAGAFTLKANAQKTVNAFDPALYKKGYTDQSGYMVIKLDTGAATQLLADETTITYTKTGAKIECSNDTVHFKLYQKWQHCFIRYSWSWKKDRKGPYKQYSITISKKDAELIKIWAKDNL